MKLKAYIGGNLDLIILMSQSAVGFLFLPYLLTFVDVEQYGEIFLLQSSASFFQVFYNIGYTNTITAYSKDWQSDGIYFDQLLKILLLVVFKALIYSFIIEVIDFENFDHKGKLQYLNLIVMLSFANVIKDLFEVFQRMRNFYRFAIVFSLIHVFFETVLKIYFLKNYVFSTYNYLFIISAFKVIVFSAMLFLLIMGNCNLRKVKFRMTDFVFFRFGLNWAVANVFGKIAAYTDKPLISTAIGIETLGYYAIASKISAVSAQFRTMLKNLWIYDALKNYPNHYLFSWKNLMRPGILVTVTILLVSPLYIYSSLGEWNIEVVSYVIVFAIIEILWLIYLYSSLAPVYFKDSAKIPQIQFYSTAVYFIFLLFVYHVGISAVFLGKIAQLVTLILLQRLLESKLKRSKY